MNLDQAVLHENRLLAHIMPLRFGPQKHEAEYKPLPGDTSKGPLPAVGLPAEYPRHKWMCPNECVTPGLEVFLPRLGWPVSVPFHIRCRRHRRHLCNHTRLHLIVRSGRERRETCIYNDETRALTHLTFQTSIHHIRSAYSCVPSACHFYSLSHHHPPHSLGLFTHIHLPVDHPRWRPFL